MPSDLSRLHEKFLGRFVQSPQVDLEDWAKANLLASPGALVAKDGRAFRIRTIVPATKPDGSCHWLLDDGRCAVHADAPFGCSFTKVCEPDPSLGTAVTTAGLKAIMQDWIDRGPYSQLWTLLWETGLRAEAPEVKRDRMRST